MTGSGAPPTRAGTMRFFSDNAAPVHPAVLTALAEVDTLDTAYDGDRWSAALDEAFGRLFGREVAVLWVASGTAANCLALATLCPPYGGIVCERDAHIQVDEAGAPEFYTGGAKLLLVDGRNGKLTPDGVEGALSAIRDDVHQVQPHVLSLTNATESGSIYSAAEVRALADVAHGRGMSVHMDGARFANAVVASGEGAAALTCGAGVDALSFGFVKNGGMNAEALVFFDPAHAREARRRRKRAGHLLSKGRYLAAQLLAMLADDRWLHCARAANAAAAVLAGAAGDRLVRPCVINELFVRLSADEAAALRGQGFDFYDWGEGQARLVTSWDQAEADVAPLAAALAGL